MHGNKVLVIRGLNEKKTDPPPPSTSTYFEMNVGILPTVPLYSDSGEVLKSSSKPVLEQDPSIDVLKFGQSLLKWLTIDSCMDSFSIVRDLSSLFLRFEKSMQITACI